MSIALLGRKVGMTQIFDESGQITPVTVIELGPCMVTQIKTDAIDEATGKSRDGYNAVQVGFEQIDEKRRSHSESKYNETTKLPPHKHHKEFRVESAEAANGYELGQVLDVNAFAEISYVKAQPKVADSPERSSDTTSLVRKRPVTVVTRSSVTKAPSV